MRLGSPSALDASVKVSCAICLAGARGGSSARDADEQQNETTIERSAAFRTSRGYGPESTVIPVTAQLRSVPRAADHAKLRCMRHPLRLCRALLTLLLAPVACSP